MMEQRMQQTSDEIKAIKSSMPIAGSLLDLYFYSKVETSGSYPDGATAYYRVKFVPLDPAGGLGLTELTEDGSFLASSAYWSQFNPLGFTVKRGYKVDPDGSASIEDGFFTAGYGEFNVQVTASVYSTVPGTIEIEFW